MSKVCPVSNFEYVSGENGSKISGKTIANEKSPRHANKSFYEDYLDVKFIYPSCPGKPAQLSKVCPVSNFEYVSGENGSKMSGKTIANEKSPRHANKSFL